MLLVLLLCVIGLLSFLILFKKSDSKLPPGPPCFPLIGSLLSVLWADPRRPVVAFEKIAKKYGPVFSLKMGPSLIVVVINSHKEFVQALITDEILSHVDETDIWLLEKSNCQDLGILFSFPEMWAETRAYTHRILRKYGFGSKTATEGIVVEEVVEFCEELKSSMTGGQVTLNLTTQFNIIFFNIVWTILTGKKYQSDDIGTHRLLETMDAAAKSGTVGGGIGQLFPKLLRIFPRLTGFKNLQKRYRLWKESYVEVLKEVRRQGEYLYDPHSFLQEFLQKVDNPENHTPQQKRQKIFTDENLIAVLQDIAIGGTDTQAHLIKFLIRYLLYNPHVQENLQLEVDKVIGMNRRVSSEDIPNLVYLQATLYELYRITSVIPVVVRKLLEDWKFGIYEIPKGALVIMNLWTASKDEAVWRDPTKFMPERFLSKDGQALIDKILSFSFGKRRCIGEQLAKTSMVLVTATLIQEFSFHCDPSSGLPSQEIEHGFSLDPVPFKVIIRAR